MVTPLAVKGEVILGVQLVTRHRAPRLAGLLALGVAGLAAVSGPTPERVGRVVLLAAALLGTVAASRLLSPGPALSAARMVVAPWWLVPVGRLAGLLAVLAPVTLALAVALAASAPGGTPVARSTAVALAYATCLATCTMALAPFWGASAAASTGFLAVWFGNVPPSAIATLFAGWPPAQRMLVWLWDLLPLPWRAARWLDGASRSDALLLLTWTLIGLGLAALALVGPRRAGRRGEP